MVTLGNTRSVDPKSTRLGRRFSRGVAGESGELAFSIHAEDGRGCA